MGRQIDVVQKFTRTQSFGQNWMVSQWNSSGIFSQDPPHSISATKSKSSFPTWAQNQKISLDGLSSCRCSTTSHGWSKDNKKRMRIKCSTRFSLCEKICSRTMVIPRTWIRKEVVFYKENGTELQQMMLTFAESKHPVFRSSSPVIQRSAQKQRWVKIVNTLLRWPENDWNCFAHSYFC